MPSRSLIAVGVLAGRIIEAIAVGAVLFALWTYVGRLVFGSNDQRPDVAGEADGER